MATTDVNDITDKLDKILRHGVNTTCWEDDFVNRMQAKVDAYGERAKFSEAEADKIDEIYAERTP